MKPSNAARAVKFLIEHRSPAFLWGAPGIGKSDLVRQVAKDLGMSLIDKRMSQADPTELKGFPMPNAKNSTMEFFRDGELPTKGKGILFLDELPNAPPAVQNASYQLILDRRLGSYELPPDWHCVAAGNEAKHRSNTFAMSKALAGRFQHIHVQPDVDDWIDWAVANGIRPLTRGYIRFRPSNLFTDVFKGDENAYPSPRSWAKADKIVHSALEDSMKLELLIGTIGQGCATEFLGFAKVEGSLPTLKDVLTKGTSLEIPKEPATQYAIISFLEGEAEPKNFEKICAYVERFPLDFQAIFISSCARRQEPLRSHPTYVKWLTKNHGAIVGR